MKHNFFVNVIANILLVAVIIVVASAVFAGNSTSVFSSKDNSPIYRGKGKNCVSLMINVYWGNEYIAQMLKILQENNAKATFFVGGNWVAKYPDVFAQIVEQGHEIGNHGYYHKNMSALQYENCLTEIRACNKIVFEYCGIIPKLFAPPSGDFNDVTLQCATDSGCKTVMWSKDTIDWQDKDSQVIFSRATKNISEGDIVLMHPTLHTAKALDEILKCYIAQGFKVVTVSDNVFATDI